MMMQNINIELSCKLLLLAINIKYYGVLGYTAKELVSVIRLWTTDVALTLGMREDSEGTPGPGGATYKGYNHVQIGTIVGLEWSWSGTRLGLA